MINQAFWDLFLKRIEEYKGSGYPYAIINPTREFMQKKLREGRITQEIYDRFEQIIKR
ncbi:MAG: hypothetical protein WC477_05200 [Patescibacteria group bacterium]